MKTLVTLLVIAVGVGAALSGCIIVSSDRHYYPATKKELEAVRQVDPGQGPPTVRTVYADQVGKLMPGMPVDSFKALFPTAVFVEQKDETGHKLDAYSVKLGEPYRVRGENCIQTSHDEAWFYFRDGQFVKWGEPKQWP
jgi:hypothetical protein